MSQAFHPHFIIIDEYCMSNPLVEVNYAPRRVTINALSPRKKETKLHGPVSAHKYKDWK